MADLGSTPTLQQQFFTQNSTDSQIQRAMGQNGASGGLMLSGANPNGTIQQNAQEATQIVSMGYPLDPPRYYMNFGIMVGGPSFGGGIAPSGLGWAGTGMTTTTIGSIRMPLPDNLIDTQSVNYSETNFLQEAFNVGGKIMTGITAGLIGGLSHNMSTAATSGAAAYGIGQVIEGAFRFAGDIVRLRGISPNQMVTVLLQGPQYKQLNFSWTLVPRKHEESMVLADIIRTLKDAQAVGYAGNGWFWTFPNIIQLSFTCPDQRTMFQFKPAVMTAFKVDYAGGHGPAFHKDGAPQGYMLQMQLLEIEYWTKGQYGSAITNNGQQFTQQVLEDANKALRSIVGMLPTPKTADVTQNPPNPTTPTG